VDALAAARPGGRVLLFAAKRSGNEDRISCRGRGNRRKKKSWAAIVRPLTSEAGADLVLKKKLPVMEIVTHRFRLARIQEGLDLAAKPTEESLKILITHA